MRLSGIDTPEIRPKLNKENRVAEVAAAKYVRNRFLDLITDQEIDLKTKYSKKKIKDVLGASRKIVYLKCGKFEKYGRCLIKIFLSEEDLVDKTKSVNKILLNEGLAYKYYGGKRNKDFTSYFKPLKIKE